MRCAIYARVSKKKEEGISIDAQINSLKSYIKKKKWMLYKEYVDDGKSGATINRPQFRYLLEDAVEGKFDVILVYKIDRFSRNLKDIILTLDKLANYNIEFISITQPVDTTDAMGKAFMRIMAVFAELERDIIRERVSFSMIEKAKRGHPQHRAPFGYYFKNKHLVIRKAKARIVKKVYRDFLKGLNRYELAKKYKKSFQTTTNILSNPLYYGIIRWGGRTLQGRHKAIITKKVFNSVQQKLKK